MKKLVIAGLLSAFLAPSFAQTIKLSTGSAKGSYSRITKELAGACGSQVAITEVNSSGAMENVDRIIGNEVQGGWAQTDVMYFRAKTDDLDSIKTLITMYPEEVAIIAMNTIRKEGGMMGFGGKEVSVNTLGDLANRKVGAWGGGLVSAQIIRLQSEVPFTVQPVTNETDGLKKLAAGEIDAILAVGGSPLEWIKPLDRNYKLLSISEQHVNKLKGVYKPARISYTNLGQSGVTTVATDAIIVVQDYKSAKYVETLTKLRSCLNEKLVELKETPGTHPKWRLVNANEKAKWPMYEAAATTGMKAN